MSDSQYPPGQQYPGTSGGPQFRAQGPSYAYDSYQPAVNNPPAQYRPNQPNTAVAGRPGAQGAANGMQNYGQPQANAPGQALYTAPPNNYGNSGRPAGNNPPAQAGPANPLAGFRSQGAANGMQNYGQNRAPAPQPQQRPAGPANGARRAPNSPPTSATANPNAPPASTSRSNASTTGAPVNKIPTLKHTGEDKIEYEARNRHSSEGDSFYSEKVDQSGSGYKQPIHSSEMAKVTGFASVIAGVLTLIATVLLWILYNRTKESYYWWLAFWGTILGVLLIANIGLGLMSSSAILQDKPENKLFSSLTYLIPIVAACFLITSVLLMLFWKYVHFNKLVIIFDDKAAFEKRYPSGLSFEDAWKSDKKYVWWSAFLFFVAGIASMAAAMIYWSVTKLMIEVSRGVMAICGAIAVGLLCMSIYAADQGLSSNITHPSVSPFISIAAIRVIKWIGVILLAMLLANLVFNIVKKRVVFFVLGVVVLFLVVALATTAAVQLRAVRDNISPGKENSDSAIDSLYTLHKDDISPACSKYLPEGQSCGKKYNIYGPENSDKKLSIYPGCARNARVFMFMPFIDASMFAIYAAVFACVVVACDFYAADTTEYIESYNKRTNILDLVGCGLAFLFLLIFLGYLIFSKDSTFRQLKKSVVSDPLLVALEKGTHREEGWTSVPTSIQTSDRASSNVCIPYDKDKFVSLASNPTCTFKRCGYRVFILTEAVEFYFVEKYPDTIGSSNMKTIVFPNAKNSIDSFLYLKGTAEDINQQLSQIKFCHLRYDQELSMFFNIETVDLDQLTTEGFRMNEFPSAPHISTNGKRDFPPGYSYGNGLVCNLDICQFENRLAGSTTSNEIIGTIFIKNKADAVFGFLPLDYAKTIKIAAYHGNEAYRAPTENLIDEKGIFAITVPASTNAIYPLRLEISDPAGNFMTYKKEVPISSIDKQKVSIGKIPLLLPSGQGCIGDPDFKKCVEANKTPAKATLKVKVLNSDTNLPVASAQITIEQGHTVKRTTLDTGLTTDENGLIEIKDKEFGYYTVYGWTSNLIENNAQIAFDPNTNTAILYLIPNMRTAMDVSLNIANSLNTDSDIKLKFKQDDGKTCFINAENRYCGYAAYLYDVAKGQTGVETIRVFDMTTSTYMAFSETVYNPGDTCPSYTNSLTHFAQLSAQPAHAQGGDASFTPDSDELNRYWLAYCFTGFGQQSVKTVNKKFATEPDIKVCEELFPEADKHSLKNLKVAIENLPKK